MPLNLEGEKKCLIAIQASREHIAKESPFRDFAAEELDTLQCAEWPTFVAFRIT